MVRVVGLGGNFGRQQMLQWFSATARGDFVYRSRLTCGFDYAFEHAAEAAVRHFVKVKAGYGSWSEWLNKGDIEDLGANAAVQMYEAGPHDWIESHPMRTVMGLAFAGTTVAFELVADAYEIATDLGPFRAQGLLVDASGFEKRGLGFMSRFGDAPVFVSGYVLAAPSAAVTPEAVGGLIDSMARLRPLRTRRGRAWLRERPSRPATPRIRVLGGEGFGFPSGV